MFLIWLVQDESRGVLVLHVAEGVSNIELAVGSVGQRNAHASFKFMSSCVIAIQSYSFINKLFNTCFPIRISLWLLWRLRVHCYCKGVLVTPSVCTNACSFNTTVLLYAVFPVAFFIVCIVLLIRASLALWLLLAAS